MPMEGHSDNDLDFSEDVVEELPDMFDYSDSDDEADPRSRYALPSQYERAKLQKENGEEYWVESDSEGESSGRSEYSESR